MQIYNGQIDPQLGLTAAQAMAASEYRAATSAELAKATKKLGKSGSDPLMLRRVVALNIDGALALLIDHPISCSDLGCAVGDHLNAATTPVQVALPLVEALELLQSEKNPESELQRRQKFVADARAEVQAKYEREYQATCARAAVERKQAAERVQFHAAEWADLPEVERFARRLVLAVEKRDPLLAEDVRGALVGMREFPRTEWWKTETA